MGWSTVAQAAQVNAVGSESTAVYIAAFSDSACTVEITGGAYTRVEGVWPETATNTTTTDEVELNIPAGTVVRGVGRFATASGGTAFETRALSPEESFGSAGKLFVTNTLTASA
jgi:hypothetical protein